MSASHRNDPITRRSPHQGVLAPMLPKRPCLPPEASVSDPGRTSRGCSGNEASLVSLSELVKSAAQGAAHPWKGSGTGVAPRPHQRHRCPKRACETTRFTDPCVQLIFETEWSAHAALNLL